MERTNERFVLSKKNLPSLSRRQPLRAPPPPLFHPSTFLSHPSHAMRSLALTLCLAVLLLAVMAAQPADGEAGRGKERREGKGGAWQGGPNWRRPLCPGRSGGHTPCPLGSLNSPPSPSLCHTCSVRPVSQAALGWLGVVSAGAGDPARGGGGRCRESP